MAGVEYVEILRAFVVAHGVPYPNRVVGEPAADVQRLLEVILAHAQSQAKLSWTAVRPILLALREYWEARGFFAHGIQFSAVLNELPAEHEGMLGATDRP